ncbi:MAG: DUF7003 family protein [Thermoguttaceae bacterium]
MRYTDDIISFETPEGFPAEVSFKNRGWGYSKNSRGYSINVAPMKGYKTVLKQFKRNLIVYELPVPNTEGCIAAGFNEQQSELSSRTVWHEFIFALDFQDFTLVVHVGDTCKPGEVIPFQKYLPVLDGLVFDYEKYQEYCREYDRKFDERIIKMGSKKRQAIAAKYGLSEEMIFQDLRRLENGYGAECVRDGYLPGEQPKKKKKVVISKRAQKILDELDSDSDNPYRFMPDLEHGYFYTAGSRITLFGDENRWAFVFEKSGYENRGQRVSIELHYFGNCLKNLERAGLNNAYVSNGKSIELFHTDSICDDFENISTNAKTITVRETEVPLHRDPKLYRKHKIDLNDPAAIGIVELTRLLDERNPDLFRATEEELRACLPDDLPQIMVIDQWHHESVCEEGKLMSECEVYRQIAEVLATLDPKKWKPTKKPNNDWRNRLEAGGL